MTLPDVHYKPRRRSSIALSGAGSRLEANPARLKSLEDAHANEEIAECQAK
jgi:hypothetical protein